jgi:hypothetical protein
MDHLRLRSLEGIHHYFVRLIDRDFLLISIVDTDSADLGVAFSCPLFERFERSIELRFRPFHLSVIERLDRLPRLLDHALDSVGPTSEDFEPGQM